MWLRRKPKGLAKSPTGDLKPTAFEPVLEPAASQGVEVLAEADDGRQVIRHRGVEFRVQPSGDYWALRGFVTDRGQRDHGSGPSSVVDDSRADLIAATVRFIDRAFHEREMEAQLRERLGGQA